jgi:apolipoprotein N-acyltransferase
MRFLKLQPNERYRYPFAILAGLLLAASFPKLSLGGLAWIAPGMILASALGTSGGAAFRIGYVAGLTFFLASLYWLLKIPVAFAPILGWLALSWYLAFYPALWVWLCWRIYPRTQTSDADLKDLEEFTSSETQLTVRVRARLHPLLEDFLATSWLQRLAWSFFCAALWVAWEIVQGRLFTGFPWTLLGVTQYQMLPLIQISSFTGVYGVSFVLVWFSIALLCAGITVMRRPEPVWVWSREIAVPLLVVMGVLGFGLHRVLTASAPSARLKVLMVQPSIPQTIIWDVKESDTRFAELIQLTEEGLAKAKQVDLLIWPEAAVPSLFRYDTNAIYKGQTVYETVTNLVHKHNLWLILGADDAVIRPEAPEGADFYNSSFLISPDGQIRGTYRKQNLVIFGEYVPFSRWFPFLMDLAHVYGAFTRGTGPVAFNMPDLRVKTSVLICFEDIFPHVARRAVNRDTDFLVNVTNDGWFRESAAQWQHAANAIFRAVENGLPLVRVTNNGLTCWADAQGGLHEVYYPGFSNVYAAGYKIAFIPLLGGHLRNPTFYTRHGDWFGWSCVGLAGLLMASQILTLLTKKNPPPA